jgi:hypothetical protein
MFHQFEMIGVRLSLQRQLWSRPHIRAMSRRQRAIRRRRLHAVVLAPPRPRRRNARHEAVWS